MAGDHARRRATILRSSRNARGTSYVSPYHFAYVLHRSRRDRSRDGLLERAVAERSGPSYAIKGSFLLKPLRGHPRFQALLRQMNLA